MFKHDLKCSLRECSWRTQPFLWEPEIQKKSTFVMKFHQQVLFSLCINVTQRVVYANVNVVHNVAFVR